MEKRSPLYKLAQDIIRLFPRGEEEYAVRMDGNWNKCDWLDTDSERNRFRGRFSVKLMGEWRKLFVRGSYRRIGFSQRNREVTCLVAHSERNNHVGIWTHATGWDFPDLDPDLDVIPQAEHEPEEFTKHYERMAKLLEAARILQVPVNIRTMDGMSPEQPRGELINNTAQLACDYDRHRSGLSTFWICHADSPKEGFRALNYHDLEAVTSLVDGCLLDRMTPEHLECSRIALIKAWQCNQLVSINQGAGFQEITYTVVNPFAMVEGRRGVEVRTDIGDRFQMPLDTIFTVEAVGEPNVSLNMLVPDCIHRDRLQAAQRTMKSVPFIMRNAQLLDGTTIENSHTGFVRVWLLDGTIMENCEVQVCSDESPADGNQLVLGRFNNFDGHAKDLRYFKDLSTIAKVEPMHPEVDMDAQRPA